MLKQTLTYSREKSQGDFQRSKIGTLRKNISPSADFMWQFRTFFCHVCAEIMLFVIFKNEIINNTKGRCIKVNLLELWESQDFKRIPICSNSSNKNC